MNLDIYQLQILAMAVAMAGYVGSVSRGVIKAVNRKNLPSKNQKQTLGLLFFAELLLLAIVAALTLRIYGFVKCPDFDRLIKGLIATAIGYMILLHMIQWYMSIKIFTRGRTPDIIATLDAYHEKQKRKI